MDSEKGSKSSNNFHCEKCDYLTSRSSQYDRHILTNKHIRIHMDSNEDSKKVPLHQCNCGNVYKYRQGLVKHKSKCSPIPISIVENKMEVATKESIPEYITLLIDNTKELQNIIIEQNKTIVDLAAKAGNTNSNNNTQFNLQFFLNETCKDAINAGEFIENLKISFADLENIGNKGYVDGITNIIVNELKTMDITKRPFHCTDMKRETMYIKEKDEWNKDNEDKSKLICVINNVLNKNKVIANEWYKTHPEINVLDSPDYLMHMKLFEQLLAQENENKLKEKIVKNIAKETGNIR